MSRGILRKYGSVLNPHHEAGLLWRPRRVAGPPGGAIRGDGLFWRFGRGENIGVVVEIPLAIVATLQIGQALDNHQQPSSDPDYISVTTPKAGTRKNPDW